MQAGTGAGVGRGHLLEPLLSGQLVAQSKGEVCKGERDSPLSRLAALGICAAEGVATRGAGPHPGAQLSGWGRRDVAEAAHAAQHTHLARTQDVDALDMTGGATADLQQRQCLLEVGNQAL